ncbi:MAG: CopK family periplasmic copper-binding protein [Gammaproteobacteria bacterium]|nr:CopK family periplasmic copper-binding protein [Gammaproteobacteria bacterium]MBU0786574.1 CopK family periplasmic copper-binding protein [Gammaproteobacteria bacterium]MBU0817182.1 CopK family periplasmic copper-binding protein [Gammaproteobacteria bacterium]MBU1787698.1 CopK family periplasmic copper-binding protein [Gammaproteobacteria bacterium]
MKSTLSVITIVASIAFGSIAAPAQANNSVASSVKQSIPLKGGATLHVFADGKMAKEDKYGRASFMMPEEALVSIDGKTIKPVGNEVARLSALIGEGHY